MTLPELFQKRFGARVRWASGVVIVLGGLLKMGVFLRTGGEFLLQVAGLERLFAAGFSPLANPDMGWPCLLFNSCLMLATVLTWQTTIQRVLSAKDARTGRQVYVRTIFFVARFLVPGIWGIAALATLAPEAVGADTLHAMPTWLAGF